MPLESLLEVVELKKVEDRGEDLLADDGHIGARAYDGRPDITAARQIELLTPIQDFAPLLANEFESARHVIHRSRADERADECAGLERIADGHLFVSVDEALGHGLRDSFLQQKPARGGAALAGGSNGTE